MCLLSCGLCPTCPEAGAGDDDHLGPMQEPIQASRRQQRIAEQIGPLVRGPIAGQDDAATLITLVDEIVQVLRRWRAQRLEAKVVQHQQVRAQIGLESPFQGAIRPAAIQVLEEPIGVDEQGIIVPTAGFMNQGLRQVGFDPSM